MSGWQDRRIFWRLLTLIAVAHTAMAADRTPSTTTIQKSVRTAPAVKTTALSPEQTAQQLRLKNTTAAPALRTMIQTHRLSLSAADRYLADAKYSAVDRADAVRATYNVRQAAAALLQSAVAPQDAYLQLRCWHYPAPDAASAVSGTYPAASTEEIAEGMAAEGASDEDIVAFLYQSGYTAQQIAAFLEQNLGRTAKKVTELLLRVVAAASNVTEQNLQFIYARVKSLFGTADAAGNWLLATVGMTWEKAAAVLVRAGYVTKKIAGWLKNTVGVSASSIAGFLKNVAGMTAQKTLGLLKEIGFSPSAIWDAMKAKFGTTTTRLIEWLKQEGVSAQQMARLLVDKVGATAGQVFDWLLAAGYSMQSVLNVLVEVFEWTQDQILALLAAKNKLTSAVISMLNAMF